MKNAPTPYINMNLKGQREEMAKTSWKKKRGTIQMTVDQNKFGSTTMNTIGAGLAENDTGAQTIDVLGTDSENIYSPAVHNRNMSMGRSTFYDSTGNIQSNIRKLDPLNKTIDSSGNNQQVKMVANLMKGGKMSGTKSRQNGIGNTVDNKARKLDKHLDGLTAAEIYSNANNKPKAQSRTAA